jgi:hypothetical protein
VVTVGWGGLLYGKRGGLAQAHGVSGPRTCTSALPCRCGKNRALVSRGGASSCSKKATHMSSGSCGASSARPCPLRGK